MARRVSNGYSVRGWEKILPAKLPYCVGVLSSKSAGKVHFAIASTQIFSVNLSHSLNLFTQSVHHVERHHCHALAASLCLPDRDLQIAKVNVLNSQPHAFHNPQATSVKQVCHQSSRPSDSGQHRARLKLGEYDGQLRRSLRSHNVIDPRQAFL